MNKLIIILAFLVFCATLSAQNLVPNPSFEISKNNIFSATPDDYYLYAYSGERTFKEDLYDWKSATKGTPDVRVMKDSYKTYCESEQGICDQPRTGKNVAGIVTFMENERTGGNREYIQVKLKKPLQPGKTTHLELWIKNEAFSHHISNNIGFYFSTKKIYIDYVGPIKLKPQYNHNELIQRSDEWIQIKGSFIPDKPHHYLTIGNFFGNEDTKLEKPTPWRDPNPLATPKAYYLIDDVAVYQDKNPPKPPTPEPTKVITNTFKEEPISIGTTIALKNVEFDSNSDKLMPRSYQELSELVNWMRSFTTVKIGIQGHTDNVGSDSDNLTLSINRAKRIYDYLIENGINNNRLTFKGFGESTPIANNTSDEGRKRNRRVEFVVLSK